MSGSGGYTAGTEAIATASKNITQYSKDLLDANPDLATTLVTKEGFGKAHGDKAQKYLDGAKALSDAVTGYNSTLATFGSSLESAGSKYAINEDDQYGQINGAGGEL
ncbi:hypothetical protein [Amycolatopsis sp. PS_44_ISF1]|uniref:hypothetical protein n=1 Tax=Amycolatopsis sp. PS_44_ISF1 TaxID=2974917 RepID=UPI0028DED047|nr:hypothetical protein [Amycolatopsis sp. PS_44_ISF1]MDT8911260.1 hypothetical protein [Amycolatopsis sp. PS_44_ISF1]